MLNISVYDMTFTTDTTIPYNCPWYLQCHGNAGESDNTYIKKDHDISGSHFFFKMTAISSRIQALHWTMNSFFFWLKIIIEVGTRISSYLINGFSQVEFQYTVLGKNSSWFMRDKWSWPIVQLYNNLLERKSSVI